MEKENQSFTVELEFGYDAQKGIHTMKVPIINGEPGEKVPYVESNEKTYVGITNTTIILTKKTDEEADPCVWIWNAILQRWFRRCWVPQF